MISADHNKLLATIANSVGTPCYVYSADAILAAWHAYDKAFGDLPHLVCYAVKANSNLSLLKLLADAGAGFDIVSGGELFRVLRAGGDPKKIVFSGVGKTEAEIELALQSGIGAFNCESDSGTCAPPESVATSVLRFWTIRQSSKPPTRF